MVRQYEETERLAARVEAAAELLPPPSGGADVTTVPPGHVIRYGYVRFRDIDLRDFGGMFPEAFLKWLARYRDLGDSQHQFAECPFGHWDGETFVVENGRHRLLAAVFQGYPWILVRWLEAQG